MKKRLELAALGAGLAFNAMALPVPDSAPVRLTDSQRSAALQSIESAFREKYVFPEMRAAIIERLATSRAAGRYDVDDATVFADRITDDLKAVSHDGHLYLRVDPAAYDAALAPRTSDAGEDAYARGKALRNHHGLRELRVLPGNIRYLRISGFEWVRDETGTAYDDAMRFLRDGDAIVIDLRGNGGGAHPAVRYLVSHFLDDETLLLTFLSGDAPPMQSWTLDHVPAGRLKRKPLYVLIDGSTGSAAEEFAYHVRQFRLGELVGATTAGAANNNERMPIAPCFILSVSYGRPVHAISQSNWEGAGIAPTIETAPGQALEIAQSLALRKLSANADASPAARAEYAWAEAGVTARLHPAAPSADRLKRYAGHYDEATIDYRDQSLWLSRPDRRTVRLVPLDDAGLFAFEGSDDNRARLTDRTLEVLRLGAPAPRVFVRR